MGTALYDRGVVATMRTITTVHRVLNRLSGGRLGRRVAGADMVWLTVKGRKSGELRRVPVVTARGTHDGRPRLLVAGSRGGTEKHPAWALNLRGHIERGEPAELEFEGEHFDVDVRELEGAERDAGYSEMVEAYKGFADYEQQTNRRIPVFALTVRKPPAA
jgi:deazaflavin-dependent oxidoreductase (nitroreductase family)